MIISVKGHRDIYEQHLLLFFFFLFCMCEIAVRAPVKRTIQLVNSLIELYARTTISKIQVTAFGEFCDFIFGAQGLISR